MPDLLQETRVSLTQLARQEGVSIPTTWRWAMRGIRGIRLETFMAGGRRYCTQESYRRAVDRWTAAANGTSVSSPLSHDTDRHERLVEEQLEKAGL